MAVHFKHRSVWEKAHGRLPRNHMIHHVDGDRGNNALSNLAAVTQMEHSRIHRDSGLVARGEYVRCDQFGRTLAERNDIQLQNILRLPKALLDAIDGVAAVNGEHDEEWASMPRAEVIRRLLLRALHGDEFGTDPAQLWREKREG